MKELNNKTKIINYRNYSGSVNYCDDDNIFYGKIIDITDLISYEGKSILELEKHFKILVDEYIDMLNRKGGKFFEEMKESSFTIPDEFIDQCPRCRYKFEYKKLLIKRCYCGSCTADITDTYIRILLNHISREETIKIYEGKIKYSKEEIEVIRKRIENRYSSSCELAPDDEEEIDPEELLIELQKNLKDTEEPRDIFKTFNIDDLDRLIDFEESEGEN